MASEESQVLSSAALRHFVQEVEIAVPERAKLLLVPKDRARLVFSEWERRLRDRAAWLTPFLLAVTFALTWATSKFATHGPVSSGFEKGVFVAAFAGVLWWLARSLVLGRRAGDVTPERFIRDLCEGAETVSLQASAPPRQP